MCYTLDRNKVATGFLGCNFTYIAVKQGGVEFVEKWEQAYEDYVEGTKYATIAKKYGVSINTVKTWKNRKWGDMAKNEPPARRQQIAMMEEKKKKNNGKTGYEPVIKNDNLTDQQKMFCLNYLKYFNATKAYQQAFQCDYSTANSHGYRLLSRAVIKEELRRLKEEMHRESMFDAKDLLEEYLKQAFADITDFVEFGTENVLFDDFEERPVSFVRLKSDKEVDGTLVQEIKKGRDGISIKLYDKHKAMSELMKYFTPDELREAQTKKTKAEAKIAENRASKLSLDKNNQAQIADLINIGKQIIGGEDE